MMMTGVAVLVATCALGVDYGWQPVADGGIEYIIRIDAEALESLRNGEDIASDLPRGMERVRSYRITTESGPLPHQSEPPPEAEPAGPELSPGTAEDSEQESVDVGPNFDPGPDAAPPLLEEDDLADTWPPGARRPAGRYPTRRPGTGAHEGTDPGDSSSKGAATDSGEPGMFEPDAGMEAAGEVEPAGFTKSAKSRGSSQDDDGASGVTPNSPSDRLLADEVAETGADEERPWVPLVLVTLGLFASLGGNLFQGWLLVGMRRHLRALLARAPLSRI